MLYNMKQKCLLYTMPSTLCYNAFKIGSHCCKYHNNEIVPRQQDPARAPRGIRCCSAAAALLFALQRIAAHLMAASRCHRTYGLQSPLLIKNWPIPACFQTC